jgi:threonine/homoserine/homoserine lactone efflux protein
MDNEPYPVPAWRRLLSLPLIIAGAISLFAAAGNFASFGHTPSGVVISLLYLAGGIILIWIGAKLRTKSDERQSSED